MILMTLHVNNLLLHSIFHTWMVKHRSPVESAPFQATQSVSVTCPISNTAPVTCPTWWEESILHPQTNIKRTMDLEGPVSTMFLHPPGVFRQVALTVSLKKGDDEWTIRTDQSRADPNT